MAFSISVSEPRYLTAIHYNIPLKPTWNESLLAGLEEISSEIKKADLSSDVHGVSIQRMDDLSEYGAQGDIGYSVPSQNNKPTDYYYVDIIMSVNDEEPEYWHGDQKHIRRLNSKLNNYLEDLQHYQLVRCEYMTDFDEERGILLIQRSYFVATPEH